MSKKHVDEKGRLKSKNLPVRVTEDEAQADLDKCAAKKGWKVFAAEPGTKTPVETQKSCPYYRSSSGPNVTRSPEIKCAAPYKTNVMGEVQEKEQITTFVFKDRPDGFYDKFKQCVSAKESCRAFCFKELEKFGETPAADWSTEKLIEKYQELTRKEDDEVPKKTYWTKCGRKFEKNSTADVTGYELPFNVDGSHVDGVTQELAEAFENCFSCPFKVEVKEGWPPVHKRWECRAGSKEPDNTTDWVGNLEDKNTIQIRSLDNDFLEAVLEYCEEKSNLSAGYNQDMADCRRVISVSCSQNKKGIAAKKVLIEKFFPDIEAVKSIAPIDEKIQEKNNDICPYYDEQMSCGGNKTNFCICSLYYACNLYKKAKETTTAIQEEVKEVDQVIRLRPLEVIEAEINFYKQQTAAGIIEIGKRLIEAKEQLGDSETFTKWLREKVEFSRRTAYNFIRVAKEFPDVQALARLGQTKVFTLLELPTAERQEFIEKTHIVDGTEKTVEEMTTRELKKAIAEKEEALKKTELATKKAEMAEKIAEAYKEELMRIKQQEPEVIEVEKVVYKTPDDVLLKLQKLEQKNNELSEEVQKYQKDSKEYNDLLKQIEELKSTKDSLNEYLKFSTEISDLRAGILATLKNELSPLRYTGLIEAAKNNPELENALLSILDVVRKWLDDMTKELEIPTFIEARVVHQNE